MVVQFSPSPERFGTGVRSNIMMSCIGHSFIALSTDLVQSGIGYNCAMNPRGAFFWPQALMQGRLDFCHMKAGRHGGQPTATFANEQNLQNFIVECVSKNVDVVWMAGICNNSLSNRAASDGCIADIDKIAKALSESGIKFILSGDFPAGAAFTRASPGNLEGFARVRRWCLDILPKKYAGVACIDVFDVLCLGATTTGVPIASFFDTDQLHPKVIGHYEIAKKIVAQLNIWFPAHQPLLSWNNSEDYHATLNPGGNKLANGMFAGGAGTATSWVSSGIAASMVATPAKVTTGNLEHQQITYSGNLDAAGGGHAFRQDFSTAKVVLGETMRASVFIEIDAGWSNLRGITVQCSCNDSLGAFVGSCGYLLAAGDIYPNVAFTGANALFFRTPEFKIASWGSGLFCRFTIDTTFDAIAASAAVIRFRQARVYAIDHPLGI